MKIIDIKELGIAQRQLIWALPIGFLGLFPYVMLLTIPYQLYCLLRVSTALQYGIFIRIIFLLFGVIPFLGMISLLVLSMNATKVLRSAGLKVGLLGVNRNMLEHFTDVVCPKCSQSVSLGAKVCEKCGHELEVQDSEEGKMARYDIARDGRWYFVKGERFAKLEDAIEFSLKANAAVEVAPSLK